MLCSLLIRQPLVVPLKQSMLEPLELPEEGPLDLLELLGE